MEIETKPDIAPNLTVETTGTLNTPGSGRSTGENTPTGRKTPVKPALKSASMDDDDEHDDEHEEENDDDDEILGSRTQTKKKSSKKKKKKKNRTLKWDEAKIQEHDQLRGTRMKIEEPNTPFAAHYDSGSETDGSLSSAKGNVHHKISWDALTNKLEAHAAVVTTNYPLPGSPSSSHGGGCVSSSDGGTGGHNTTDDEENEDQKRERQRLELNRLEFQEHRKRHYNEMEVVRRFRREYPDGEPTLNGHGDTEDDDDDENDGDDENE